MFSVCLRRAEETRFCSVSPARGGGWEITMEENRTRTRHVLCHDWHRVERELALFHLTVADLVEDGWQIQSTNR